MRPQLLRRDVRQRTAGPRDGGPPERPAGAERARSPLPTLRGAYGPQPAVDGTFCEDRGWHEAASRYRAFCEVHSGDRVLYLELGVGDNTPVIIKYPFWNAVGRNDHAAYACANIGGACAPAAIAGRSILADDDIDELIQNV